MKKALLLVLAFVVSIAFVTAAGAQAPAGSPEKPAVADTKEVKAETPKADKMRARGEVVSVDATAKTMVVKGKKGEMTFDVAGAKFGKKYALEDAKAGDKVVVSYKEIDGKMVAKYVGKHHHHGKKHHKKETTEAKPAEAAPATPAK
jgi:hypothetical protein